MNENVDLDTTILDKINDLLNKQEDLDEADEAGGCQLGVHGEENDEELQTTTGFVRNNHHKKGRKKYKLYDLEKSETVKNEEILYINGTEIKLQLPEERELINNCLLTGKIDNFDLLRRILENSGLSILPQVAPNFQPVVKTNLSIKEIDVLEENIRIKKVNKNGDIIEVNDKHVTTNSNESVIERVDVLERDKRYQPPRGVRNLNRPPFNNDDDDDNEDDEIRLKIFQNIIEEDSGIQDEYLERLGIDQVIQPHYVNSNSLDDFYSTDLSATNSSISSDYFLKNLLNNPSTNNNDQGSSRRGGFEEVSSCSTSATSNKQHQKGDSEAKSIYYRDGLIISAHLDTLIQHLMPTEQYAPDSEYIFTFLLCSRLFQSPVALLERLKSDLWPLSSDQQIATKIESLLAEWIRNFPYDFLDEEMRRNLDNILKGFVYLDPGFKANLLKDLQWKLGQMRLFENYLSLLEQIVKTNAIEELPRGSDEPIATHIKPIDDSFTNQKFCGNFPDDMKYEKFLLNSLYANNNNPRNLHVINEMRLSVGNYQLNLYEMCPHPQIVAHQLTHIELERLSFIGPEEFVQTFIKQTSTSADGGATECEDLFRKIHLNSEASSKDNNFKGKLTKNLENYIHWFNRLTYLVASDIVRHSKKKFRVKSVEFWIEVAHECFNIGNFNSLMAITTALNLSSISRLKKTWSKVQLLAKYSILEHQMDPSSNFCSYRSTLKAAMWRSAGATQVDDGQSRIIIPFFSLLVKDLYFLNEGCANKLPNGHVNFEKLWHFSRQITDFIEWQHVHCPFERNPSLIFYLETKPILETENQIALASFECEQPENTVEKDRYKTLKKS